jgi:ribosomal protein L40E
MKGQKVCEKCGTITGPRAYICKQCNTPFVFKAKSKEAKNTKIINKLNWHELVKGDRIKVRGGSYYVCRGEFIPMGANGKFTVCEVQYNGILGYGSNGGYQFIYMGRDFQSPVTKVWHTRHKIMKLVPKQLQTN